MLLAGAALATALSATAQAAPERLLVGLVLGGREVGAIEILRLDDRLLIPLIPFAELSGGSLEPGSEEGGRTLVTPAGRVPLSAAELIVLGGATYLPQEVVETRLATPVEFDPREYALRLDPPWRPGAEPEKPEPHGPPLTPDAEPPWAALSVLRTDLRYRRSETGDHALTGVTDLEGRLARGWWQARYEDGFVGDRQPRLREYAWFETHGHRLQLIGHQRVQLHPLLPVLELTGFQLAYTDLDLSAFARGREPRELLPRRLEPRGTFRGEGPPAGHAELRLDGVVVAVAPIGLDGHYEFRDVPVPSRRLSRVEILLFDRQNPGIPVEIREELLSASELLLPAGGVVHQGGIGHGGNLADRFLDSSFDRDSGEAGFYQWRRGIGENLTLEAAAQRLDGRHQAVAGAVVRLGPGWLVSAGVGAAGGEVGYDFSLEGHRGPWRLLGRSESKPAGFQRTLLRDTYDHALELAWNPGSHLDVALHARSRQSLTRRADFVRPALRWRPTARLDLRARPDADGEYDIDLVYRPNRRWRLAVRGDERTVADVQWRVTDSTVLSLTGEAGGTADRQGALVRWQGRGRLRPNLYAGPLVAGGKLGAQVGLAAEILPGVLARVEAVDDLAIAGRVATSPRLQLGLTADLAVSRGRLVPGRSRSVRDDRGAVAGRILTAAGSAGRSLAGAAILVDGLPRGRTGADGSYFVGGLEPGIYRLELEPENLPIELTPVEARRVVRVAGGGVTRADFRVEARYGLAGRVRTTTGEPVPDTLVMLLDAEGHELARAMTDRFGLFRLDGIRPGRYRLRATPPAPRDAQPLATEREVEVRDDFLFGQDLTLPAG